MASETSVEQLTLFRSPLRTLYYFSCSVASGVGSATHFVATHPFTLFLALPALAVYTFCLITGTATEVTDDIQEWTLYIIWWIGLGILSSIGLGTGMHSGLLFLFPHMLKVCISAETCGHVDFNTRRDVWYSSEPFHCGESAPGTVTFMDIFRKVALTAMMWGAGTAVGEVPPYFLSYQASKAGRRNEMMEEVEVQLQQLQQPTGNGGAPTKSRLGPIAQIVVAMQTWMLQVIRTHGFLGILLLASWPNAAFDLCGICCGHFQMPFMEFFGATLIGKGIVKVNMQALFFVALFRRATREALLLTLSQLLPSRLPWGDAGVTPAQQLHAFVDGQIATFKARVTAKAAEHREEGLWFWQRGMEALRRNFRDTESAKAWAYKQIPDTVPEVWGWFIFVLIGMFAVSCINTLAQSYKAWLDQQQQQAAEEDKKQQ